jgi:hypothetical protein
MYLGQIYFPAGGDVIYGIKCTTVVVQEDEWVIKCFEVYVVRNRSCAA